MGFDQGQVMVVLVIDEGDVLRAGGITATELVVFAVTQDIRRKADAVLGAKVLVDLSDVYVHRGEDRVEHVNTTDVTDGVRLELRLGGARGFRGQRLILSEIVLRQRPRACGHAGQFAGGWNLLDDFAALPQILPIECELKECFIFDDRPREFTAKLVTDVFGLGTGCAVGKEVRRIERAVAVELISLTMESIRSEER